MFTGQVISGTSTGAVSAFTLLKINTNGQWVPCSAATDQPLGVAMEAFNAEYAGPIQISGVARVTLGGTVDEGTWIVSDANGRGVARASMTATPDAVYGVIGVALKGGVSGDVIPVLINAQPHLVDAS